MVKVQSDWIDNTKLRKSIYNFNQAVKSVYEAYRLVDGLAVPLMMDAIKAPTLFKKSLFIWQGKRWDFINNGAVDPEELNKALNNKGYEFKTDGKQRILISEKDGTKYNVSIELTPEQVNDIANYPGMEEIHALKNEEPVFHFDIDELEAIDIIDGKSIEKEIETTEDNIVKFILLKELFPMIKRASRIDIFGYKTDDPNIYKVLIVSKSKEDSDWEFDSVHYILNY